MTDPPSPNCKRSDRLPPGQQLAAQGKWPVVGEREPLPDDPTGEWNVELTGLVDRPHRWTISELEAIETVTRVVDIHCVTRWSLLGVPVTGIRLNTLLRIVGPLPEACFVSFVAHTSRSHSTSLPLDELQELDAMVAWSANGGPLPREHGGPLRMVVPGRYFYKSVKWLRAIELLAEDRLGYWEAEAGYHNHADPWKEERFAVPEATRAQMRQLIESRDWSGRQLRGVSAADLDLTGLAARGAILRAADFRRAVLVGADFSRANLSNSRFAGADLRGASFVEADIEGCDFSGADLRGADLRTLSLLGVSLVSSQGRARVDRQTRFSSEGLEQLGDAQRRYLASAGIS